MNYLDTSALIKRGGNMPRLVTALVLAILAIVPAWSDAEQKLNNLLIYGEGFIFGVKEPEGWTGDTEHASDFSANVFFYSNKKALDGEAWLVHV